jgi:cytochrome c556
MRRLTLSLLGLAAGVALPAVGGSIVSAQAPTVEQRQQLMKGFGAASRELRGQVADPATLPQVAARAEELTRQAATIPSLFAPGSEGGDALPAVFERQAEFKAASDRFAELATALAAAATSGNTQAATAAFAQLGQQGCGGCHQPFRKPQS